MRTITFSYLVLVTLGIVCCIHGFVPRIDQGKETWGYVSVRNGTNMFFWLYYTTAAGDYKTRPLVVWLQGGPGASSTGIGNFLEIGPQDPSFRNRTNAWTEQANILFVDNPVGTGYSYVEDIKLLARNNTAISNDLVTFMKGFFKKVPEFENVPLYIFSESYGGKMAVKFAQALQKTVQQKKIKCQLAGVALGDSWISPVDAITSWGPYLYATSFVDSVGLAKIDTIAKAVANAAQSKNWTLATKLWSDAEKLVENVTNGVNFYNILAKNHEKNSSNEVTPPVTYNFGDPNLVRTSNKIYEEDSEQHQAYKTRVYHLKLEDHKSLKANERKYNRLLEHFRRVQKRNRRHRQFDNNNKYKQQMKFRNSHKYLESLYHRYVGQVSAELDKLMNGPIREKLKIIPKNVTWGGQSQNVFEALAADIMTPAVQNVEALLNTTAMKVVVYNGQLDLAVDTPGVEKWVENLQWAGTEQWKSAARRPIEVHAGETSGFSKTFKNFTFYWILKAGHMVPVDAGEMAITMMKEIVGIKPH